MVINIAETHPVSEAPSPYGLSPMQTGMLFQSLIAGTSAGNGYDIEQMHILLEEEIALTEFARAWALVVRRHPALSSSFQWEGVPRPQQLAHSNVDVPVEIGDWRGLDTQQRDRKRAEFLAADRERGFDLRRAPLMRVAVFRLDGTCSEIVWTVHHIVVDGRSMALVLSDVFAAYAALVARQSVPPWPSHPSFRDYVEACSGRSHQASLLHFKELLRGKTAATPLPLAEPAARPLRGRGTGEFVRIVDDEVRRAARELAQRTQTTMGTVLHAAWALVLSRLTCDGDVLFGATRACRAGGPVGNANTVVGLLMNTLPMRVCIDEGASVADTLGRVRDQSLAFREHERTPLVEIQAQGELPPGTALFETLVMFDNREINQVLRDGDPAWNSRRCTLHEQPSPPLTITAFDGEFFELRILFARRRFREAAVARIAGYLVTAMEVMARDERARLRDVDILPPEERRRILVEWNDTTRPFPDDLCIHELFERRADEQPDAIALECHGIRFTFGEVEARANRLCHALVASGARPGVCIGVCFSRGLPLVLALLAVAKSGAAYVPLDPDYPRDRLEFMVRDVNASLVLTEQCHKHLFAVTTLIVDGADESAIGAMPASRLPVCAAPTDVCYVIYTSGSTGKPKGVVLTHRAVINTFDWVTRTFAVGPGDRLLFVTSPCFDLSVYDTFGALGAGATVVVATSDDLRDPNALARAITERGITIWDSAPAALQRLTAFFPTPGPASKLRLVMLSGDWIPITLSGALKASFPGVEVRSLGGATEAAIWSNWFPVGDIDPRWTSVPYGRPIQNARYHVLDQRLQPVPVGVSGDLYIGGACLAQGYLNRAHLTHERFIADPFGAEGERLYKTGDRARYFDDGNLEFLGRADFQVKIRGFRVELGEVETALMAIDEVREALCVAYADASGQKSLAAYVVLRDGTSVSEAAIKSRLASTLPDFMVPSQIAYLVAMPVSMNGKVDRNALPSLTQRASTASFVAPRTERERRMAAIWMDLLNKDKISLDDNFFALGGHSLLAIVLVSRVSAELGIDLPLARVLEHPTVEGLVASLDPCGPPKDAGRHLVTLSRGGSRIPLVLVCGSGGFGFVFQGLARALGPSQPLYILNALGTHDESEGFNHSIEHMAEVYEPQILAACKDGPIIVGGYSFGVLVAFEVARRLRQRGRRVPLLLSFDGFAPGFPKLLPLRERLRAHVRTFLGGDSLERRAYVRDRWARLKERACVGMGRPEAAVASVGIGDELMDRRLRKVAAGLTRARLRYRPSQSDPADLLLIKTIAGERWIGNSMDDPLYGWRWWMQGNIEIGTVPGAHLTMFHPANHDRIAELVREAVDRHCPDGRQ